MTESDAVQKIWNYHLLGHALDRADLIWVLGSHDLRVADRAAELWLAGMAPRILMSGGFGNFTAGVFQKPEARLLAERAEALGVRSDAILIEDQSSNCGENVSFSRRLLDSRGIGVHSVIAVQKPYMERRTYATIRKQWPEVEVRVTSPQLSFEEYVQGSIGKNEVVNIMVGDLQRIWEYPKRGFMISQEVPDEVREAWLHLVAAGYRGHLLPDCDKK